MFPDAQLESIRQQRLHHSEQLRLGRSLRGFRGDVEAILRLPVRTADDLITLQTVGVANDVAQGVVGHHDLFRAAPEPAAGFPTLVDLDRRHFEFRLRPGLREGRERGQQKGNRRRNMSGHTVYDGRWAGWLTAAGSW